MDLSETVFASVPAEQRAAWLEEISVDPVALQEGNTALHSTPLHSMATQQRNATNAEWNSLRLFLSPFPFYTASRNAKACDIFPLLPREEVKRVLKSTGSSVDSAIPLLFDADRQRRRADRHEEKVALMRRAFAGLPPALIQEIVARNDGDVEASSAELLAVMEERQSRAERDLSAQKEQVSREKALQRSRFIEHCVATFEVLSRAEIVEVVGDAVDVAATVAKLTEMSNARKVRNLRVMFHRLPEAAVLDALEAVGYDMEAACGRLLLRDQEQQQQQQQQPVMSATERLDVTIHAAVDAMERPDADTKAAIEQMVRETVGPAAPEQQTNAKPVPSVADQQQEEGLVIIIETDARQFALGQTVASRVLAQGGAISNYDWVTLAEAGQSADQFVTWQWSKPLLHWTPTHGLWELRYFRKVNGKSKMLASTQFLCGPAVTLSLARTDSQWDVTWNAAPGGEPVTTSAWIGLYERGALHGAYMAFQYVNPNTRTASFKAPRQNGVYELRFFALRFGMVARSEPVTLQAADAVAVRVEGTKTKVDATVASCAAAKCWVGIWHANDDTPSHYRRYAWMTTPTQSFSFKTPIHSGNYCARIYGDNNKLLAQSETFTVQ